MSETFLKSVHCAVCSKSFSVQRSRLAHGRGKHCSSACQYEARRRAPKTAVTCSCVGCGAAFTRFASKLAQSKGAGKYCTRACRNIHWVGRNNPNFQNGDKVYKRGPYWFSIRRRTLARDGHKCTECGATGTLHVHHKIPYRVLKDKAAANHDSNLVTLCPPCHRREDARHKWIVTAGGPLMIPPGPLWERAKAEGLV